MIEKNIISSFTVAPEKVTITGPKTAKVGDSLKFNCETANSNPNATVQWVVDGRTIHDDNTQVCIYPLLQPQKHAHGQDAKTEL